jgi:hypothetical protein
MLNKKHDKLILRKCKIRKSYQLGETSFSAEGINRTQVRLRSITAFG